MPQAVGEENRVARRRSKLNPALGPFRQTTLGKIPSVATRYAAEVAAIVCGYIGEEILDLEVERLAVRLEAKIAQRRAAVGVPGEGHLAASIADVEHRAHDLEIGPQQIDNDAEGLRMVEQ